MNYYIITQDIVDTYQDFVKDDFGIHFRQDKLNRWVINVGCGEEIFTEIDWNSFPIISLTNDDFPTIDFPPLNSPPNE